MQSIVAWKSLLKLWGKKKNAKQKGFEEQWNLRQGDILFCLARCSGEWKVYSFYPLKGVCSVVYKFLPSESSFFGCGTQGHHFEYSYIVLWYNVAFMRWDVERAVLALNASLKHCFWSSSVCLAFFVFSIIASFFFLDVFPLKVCFSPLNFICSRLGNQMANI